VQIHIQCPEALHALLPSGDNRKPTQTLHAALLTLRETLFRLVDTEYHTLPKTTTMTGTQVHHSWIPHLLVGDIPLLPKPGFTRITSHTSRHRGCPPTTNESLTNEHYLVPSEVLNTPFDILEISSHRTIITQTTYLVSQWSPELLTQQQIQLHLAEGFKVQLQIPLLDCADTYEVHWEPAWQTYETIMGTATGPQALDTYRRNQFAQRKKPRTTPPLATCQPGGWIPQHVTFSTQPINPDLDGQPLGHTYLSIHPADTHLAILHRPDGRVINTIDIDRVNKLWSLFQPTHTQHTFEEALAALLCRTNTHLNRRKALRELNLTKHINPEQHPILQSRWPIPEPIYDALHRAFHIQRVLDCSPMDLPIHASEYYNRHPEDAAFSAGLHTATAWTGTSLSLPDHTAEALTHSLE